MAQSETAPFEIAANGSIVGAGLSIPARDQLTPGTVIVSVDLLNRVYKAGFMAGRLPPMGLPPGVHQLKVVATANVGPDQLTLDMELPNGAQLTHIVRADARADAYKCPAHKSRATLKLEILSWVLAEHKTWRTPTSVDVAEKFGITVEEAEELRVELEKQGEL